MKKLFTLISFLLLSGMSIAQDKIKITEDDYGNNDVAMADQFREDGKIYVVVGIILLILVGMIVYLVTMDRKLSKLEKQLNNSDK